MCPTILGIGPRDFGRAECCDEDFGGSHNHCTRCGAVTSSFGHQTAEECEDARTLGLTRPQIAARYRQQTH